MPDCVNRIRSSPSLPKTAVVEAIHPARAEMPVRSLCQLWPGLSSPSAFANPARTAGPASPMADSVPAAPDSDTRSKAGRKAASAARCACKGQPQPATTAPKLVGVATCP